ncbi:transposase [Candidatus Margulisiibacteriota bacterium]
MNSCTHGNDFIFKKYEEEFNMKKYKHYISVDWAQRNMAISRLSSGMKKPLTIDVPSSIKELKVFLKNLSGTKILTFEETSTSHWLYTELCEYVNETIVCNPLRNKLLGYGPKNDVIDAEKLVKLLKNDLLDPVYHNGSEYFQLRKLVSGYQSIIKNGVRLKNQRAALFISIGKNKKETTLEETHETFVLTTLDHLIEANEKQVDLYVSQFKTIKKTNKIIQHLVSIPGFAEKSAVKLLAIVIDPRRFSHKGKWLSYCGLVKHEKTSGGRSYGRRSAPYSREAKSIFKIAAFSCIRHGNKENVFRRYYEQLLERGIAEHNARNAVARRIAVIALGILKNNTPFEDRWKEEVSKQ